jgi:hypothetical protein
MQWAGSVTWLGEARKIILVRKLTEPLGRINVDERVKNFNKQVSVMWSDAGPR